jgi:S1-C subfamily serine protease
VAAAVLAAVGLLVGILIGVALESGPSTPAASTTPGATTAPATTPTTTAPATPGSSPTTPGGPAASPGTSTPGGGSTPGGVSSSSAAAIAAKVDPGVVDINVRFGYQNEAGAGTGMVLSSEGEILTNNHVVSGATTISVTVPSTGRSYAVNVLGTDATDDVALLQLKGASGLTPLQFGNSSTVSPGDGVVALGNAGGVGGPPSVVTGIVYSLNESATVADPGGGASEQLSGLIASNTPIQPGDSGGPLVNTAAQVIGMDTAGSTGSPAAGAALGLAIPSNTALAIAAQIRSGRATATVHIGVPGFLGVVLSNTGAAVVTALTPSSPAGAAGVTVGGTITAFAGQPVDSAATLHRLTSASHPGQAVTLGWTDANGVAHHASVVLSTGPPD